MTSHGSWAPVNWAINPAPRAYARTPRALWPKPIPRDPPTCLQTGSAGAVGSLLPHSVVVLPPTVVGEKGGSCMDIRLQSIHTIAASLAVERLIVRSAGHGHPAVTMPHTPLHAPHFSFLDGANVAAPRWRRAREYPNQWGLAGTETPGWFVRGRCDPRPGAVGRISGLAFHVHESTWTIAAA